MSATEPAYQFEPDVPEFTIGDRMAKAREFRSVTQEEMGRLMGRATSTISAWESGTNQPRNYEKVLQQWADVLAVPYEWLWGGGSRTGSFLTPVDDVMGQMELALDLSQPELIVIDTCDDNDPATWR